MRGFGRQKARLSNNLGESTPDVTVEEQAYRGCWHGDFFQRRREPMDGGLARIEEPNSQLYI